MNVLAFPCNQFGGQEPGTNAEILAFARDRYGVTFPMFAKIEVNGPGAAPLYQWLKTELPGDGDSSDISWNFAKFLVGPDGTALRRFAPPTTPADIAKAIADLRASAT